MNALLSIELELLEPANIKFVEDLLQLHPTQISWISIQLICEGGDPPLEIVAKTEENRSSLQDLIAFAQRTQEKGTSVKVWFQGRSESIRI